MSEQKIDAYTSALAGEASTRGSAHTPGPWRVVVDSRWPYGFAVESAGGSVIFGQGRMAFSSRQETLRDVLNGFHMGTPAECAEAARVNAIQVANMDLIAAAPALLAACRKAALALAHVCESDAQDAKLYGGTYEAVSAAIAAATGSAE
jgi:hypothetical protein